MVNFHAAFGHDFLQVTVGNSISDIEKYSVEDHAFRILASFEVNRHGLIPALKYKGLWLTQLAKNAHVLKTLRQNPAAAALRFVFMIGRLSDESYDRLVLMDEGEPLFYISEPDLRSVGCRFIWRRQGGENPIALMRDFYSNLYFFGTDQPVVRGLNGSLLGDTQRILQANNEVVLPSWIVSAIE